MGNPSKTATFPSDKELGDRGDHGISEIFFSGYIRSRKPNFNNHVLQIDAEGSVFHRH